MIYTANLIYKIPKQCIEEHAPLKRLQFTIGALQKEITHFKYETYLYKTEKLESDPPNTKSQ